MVVTEPRYLEKSMESLPAPAREMPILSSERLFAGYQEVVIVHGTEAYRLRITSKGKLILTK